jgi:hypothetical protein
MRGELSNTARCSIRKLEYKGIRKSKLDRIYNKKKSLDKERSLNQIYPHDKGKIQQP